MRVLVACERFGRVRDAFITRGHDAWSCDIVGASGPHIKGDVRKVLDGDWDLMIAHPDCTYLCSSGLHWNARVPGRAAKTERALTFVRTLLDAPIPRIALENPIGRIGTAIRPASQIIQPWMFGDDASKATALWLKGLPNLVPTRVIAPRIVNGKKRWANQTDSGQNRLGPSPGRAMERAKTYQGIADAMAEQWNF